MKPNGCGPREEAAREFGKRGMCMCFGMWPPVAVDHKLLLKALVAVDTTVTLVYAL